MMEASTNSLHRSFLREFITIQHKSAYHRLNSKDSKMLSFFTAHHTKSGFLNFSYEISTLVNLNRAKIITEWFDLLTMLTAPKSANGLIFFHESALSKRKHPFLNSYWHHSNT